MLLLHDNNRHWTAVACLMITVLNNITLVSCSALVSNFFTCPGVSLNEIGTKPQVRLGVMFDEPVKLNISDLRTKLNLTDGDLIPGELLIPYTLLAVVATLQAEIINNDHHILPHHHFCLHYTFIKREFKEVARGANRIYAHNSVRQIINAIKNKRQSKAHSDLMVYFSPLISIQYYRSLDICPYDTSLLSRIFLGQKYEETSCKGSKDTDLIIEVTRSSLFHATYKFILKMGWQKFGIITSCKYLVELWQQRNPDVHLILYNSNDFIASFQPFEENEINVFVFLGHMDVFYKIMIEAYNKHLTTQRHFVWILPFFSESFSIDRYFRIYNFTSEEIKIIKTALKGTVVIKPVKTRDFNLTGLKKHGRIADTQGYLADAITLQALAADNSLQEKASLSGQNICDITLQRTDYNLISRNLLNTYFAGYTGQVDFNQQCNRVTNTFTILNLVPSNDSTSTPYRVETRGHIYTSPGDVKVIFCQSNGTVSANSTLVFRDGTTDVPLDHIKRIHTRSKNQMTIFMITSAIVYIIVASLYLLFIIYQDNQGIICHDNWIFQQKNLQYMLEPSSQGLVHTGIAFVQAIQSFEDYQPFAGNIALVNGKVVKIQKIYFDASLLSNKLRRNILQLLDLNHKNVCSFIGGIVNDSNITGIMYEYCHRGSLFVVLCDPKVVFNQLFRSSFAMDAIKGLSYLHDQKVVHGRLSSNNCVIDDHWVLKLTDYGPNEFDVHKVKRGDSTKIDYIAPECQLLSQPPSVLADIYSYGIVLKDMACRQNLLSDGEMDRHSYDEDVLEKFVDLIDDCTVSNPSNRPSANVIKETLKKLTSSVNFFSYDSNTSVEIHSRNLEECVESIDTTLRAEKCQSDTTLSNYLPKTVVESIKNRVSIPLKEHQNVPIVCISFSTMLYHYSQEETATIVSNADKMLHGAATSFGLERILSTGSIWIYIGGVYETSVTVGIAEAIKAAIRILTVFKEAKQYNTLPRIAVHCGPLICGTISVNTPVHIAMGDAMSYAFALMSICSKGSILISQEVDACMIKDFNYQISYFTCLQYKEKSTFCFEIEEKTTTVSTNRKSVCNSVQRRSSLPRLHQNSESDNCDESQSEIFDSSRVWSFFVGPIRSSSSITLSSLEGEDHGSQNVTNYNTRFRKSLPLI